MSFAGPAKPGHSGDLLVSALAALRAPLVAAAAFTAATSTSLRASIALLGLATRVSTCRFLSHRFPPSGANRLGDLMFLRLAALAVHPPAIHIWHRSNQAGAALTANQR